MARDTFAPLVATRIDLLVDALGSITKVAECLGVSRPLVSKWRAGTVMPTLAQARLLIDLDHVVARACLIYVPVVAGEWLFGFNSYLEGARPIDILRVRGPREVLDAVDAAEQMAFGG